VTQQDYDLFT